MHPLIQRIDAAPSMLIAVIRGVDPKDIAIIQDRQIELVIQISAILPRDSCLPAVRRPGAVEPKTDGQLIGNGTEIGGRGNIDHPAVEFYRAIALAIALAADVALE